MLSEKVEKVLNEQIQLESFSSQLYLAMASWAERSGYEGTANFLYDHSDEERQHMLRLFHYVNYRGGQAHVGAIEAPAQDYDSVQDIFEQILEHEVYISQKINESVIDIENVGEVNCIDQNHIKEEGNTIVEENNEK